MPTQSDQLPDQPREAVMGRMPAEVFPPGEFLRDELAARGLAPWGFARLLGWPLPAVADLFAGRKAIAPETARDLALVLGTTPDFWLHLESAYRASLASHPQ
jgi:HTH-type transcriptional regulator/antitoxin HigA